MDELMIALGVAALFLIRIGIPVAVLVGVGMLIDRWQTKRETYWEQHLNDVNA